MSMASPFSASTRKAGSLESSGRHLRFSNRMSQVINSINDDVYPTRGYLDTTERKQVERMSFDERPPTSRRVARKDRFHDDDEDEVVTDVTQEYTSNRPPPQPVPRKPVTMISRSQQFDEDAEEDYARERARPPSQPRKNLDIAPLPDSKIRIKSGKEKAPIHIDENNFRDSNSRSRQDQLSIKSRPRTSNDLQRSRRKSIESLESVGGFDGGNDQERRDEDDTRSMDMGADEIEIYPDDDQKLKKSVDIAATKTNFDHAIYGTLVYNTLEFIQTPAPPGSTIKCKLVMSRGVFNEFTLYLEGYSGYDLPIMKTRRRRAVPIIYYYIDAMFIERNQSKDTQTIPFGRLSSNVKRKNFSLVGNRNGNADNKSLSGSIQSLNLAPSLDEQLNSTSQVINQKKYFDLTYNTKLFGTSKPKEFVVDALINPTESEPLARRDSIRQRGGRESANRLRDSSENFRRVTKRVTLLNKKAEYDPITKKYRLDFHGRAKAPSANNIQVIDESDPKTILFQLGKVKSKCYYLDYSYPLCAFQALGIAISCLTRN